MRHQQAEIIQCLFRQDKTPLDSRLNALLARYEALLRKDASLTWGSPSLVNPAYLRCTLTGGTSGAGPSGIEPPAALAHRASFSSNS